MSVTIYHNPDCGTSRNTLAMIRQSGVEPEVIDYLRTPPDRARIVALVAAAGLTLRQALRQTRPVEYHEPPRRTRLSP